MKLKSSDDRNRTLLNRDEALPTECRDEILFSFETKHAASDILGDSKSDPMSSRLLA